MISRTFFSRDVMVGSCDDYVMMAGGTIGGVALNLSTDGVRDDARCDAGRLFVPLRILNGRVPSAQLVYCRIVADFARFACPPGALVRIGLPVVMLDAARPIKGLFCRYTARRGVKSVLGARPPRLRDLSPTEFVNLEP